MTQRSEQVDPLSLEDFVSSIKGRVSFEIPAEASPYDRLAGDLLLDSLAVFELVVLSEILSGVLLPPADLPVLDTLADLYEYYCECVRLSRDLE
jgi:acyl carrier protein